MKESHPADTLGVTLLMPSDNNEDRRVGIYFGPSSHTTLTKAYVGDFIKNEMGLVRSDGGPKWTEGLTSLIERGMNSWSEGSHGGGEVNREIKRITKQLEEYQAEVKELSTKMEKDTPIENLVDMARRIHRTEARILEVLARDENIGVKSPNYVSWETVCKETGLDRYVVVYYGKVLNDSISNGLVEIDRMEHRVKLTDEGAFDLYCSERNLDTDSIRSLNKLHRER